MENIINLYQSYGDAGYIGEKITQYQHAMQCYLLAEEYLNLNKDNFNFTDISPEEIKLGAFLHDIGHLMEFRINYVEKMGNLGVLHHENVGAEYLKNQGFSDNVCNLVSNHINTKRYLITKNDKYYNNLSEASKKTFEYQGGKMSNIEIDSFETDKLLFWHLNLRNWDDKSKSTDPELLDYINKYDLKKFLELFKF